MLIFTVIALIGILLFDLLLANYIPNFIIRIREGLTFIGTILACAFTLYSRHPSINSFLIGLVALSPHLIILARLLTQKSIAPFLSLALLTVASLLSSVFIISSQSLFAMHNGYPNTLIIIPMLWWLGVVLMILEPQQYYARGVRPQMTTRFMNIVSLSFIPCTALVWFVFTQFVFYQAKSLATDDTWCIRETDRTHIYSSLWLSPRKMFLENKYKGSTSPYLLLKLNGESWTHHWSFASMHFVKNETNAFLGNLTFHRNLQIKKPC